MKAVAKNIYYFTLLLMFRFRIRGEKSFREQWGVDATPSYPNGVMVGHAVSQKQK